MPHIIRLYLLLLELKIFFLLIKRKIFQILLKNCALQNNLIYRSQLYRIFIMSPKIIVSFCLFFPLVHTLNQLSLSYQTFNTQNYRSLNTIPISSKGNDSWITIYSSLQSGWTYQSNATLPFVSNSINGISINFTPLIAGYYQLELQTNSNFSIYQPNISFSYNSVVETTQPIVASNIFRKTLYFSNQNYIIYIWVDNLISLQAVSVYSKVKYINTTIQLVHYPYASILLIVTNVSLSNVTNQTKFSQTLASLKYKSPPTSDCLLSNNTQTNPSNFLNYSSLTNLTQLSILYNYSILTQNNSFSGDVPSGVLVIAVDNILIDCTLDVNIDLPDGLVLNQGYWIIFNEQINQTIKYIQRYTNVNVSIQQYQYQIQHSRVRIDLFYLPPNMNWGITGLNTLNIFTIDNNPCIINQIWNSTYSLQTGFYCTNTSFCLENSTYITNLPNLYLRSSQTYQIYNVSIVDMNRFQYATYVEHNIKQITYYIKQQKFKIVFNITVLPHWGANLKTDCPQITINGVMVPMFRIGFVPNPENLVQVQANLTSPYILSDNLSINFVCWQLTTIENYHIAFGINQTYPPKNIRQSQFINPNFKEAVSSLTNFTMSTLKFSVYFKNGWGIFLFNYVINNFIAFQNLMFLYYFVQFKSALNIYRREISNSMQSLVQQGSYSYFIHFIFNIDIEMFEENKNDRLQLIPSNNTLKFYDFGYSSTYLNNIIQIIISITFILIKFFIIKLISLVPISIIQRTMIYILSFWKQIILCQFIVSAPSLWILLTVRSSSFYTFGLFDFLQYLNISGFVLTSFLCFFSCILLFLVEFNQFFKVKIYISFLRKNIPSNQLIKIKLIKTFQKIKIKMESIHDINENFLYFLIPFLIGINSNTLLIWIITTFTFLRIFVLIKVRKAYKKRKVIKQMINKLLWIAFNLIYLFYWFIQYLQYDSNNQAIYRILIICDILETFIFIVGIIFQIGYIVIDCLVILLQVMVQNWLKYKKTIRIENQKLFHRKKKKQILFIQPVQNLNEDLKNPVIVSKNLQFIKNKFNKYKRVKSKKIIKSQGGFQPQTIIKDLKN